MLPLPSQATRTRRRLAALAACLGCLVPLVPRQSSLIVDASSASSRSSALPQATQLCSWAREAIGRRGLGNTGLLDTAGTYALMTFARYPGISLRITGQFPYARYMSFTAYSQRSLAVLDHLTDKDIVPNAGSTNPFQPMADRQVRNRSYTILIRQGLVPQTGRAPNTMYTGPERPVTLMYRIYAPDQHMDDFGNVPLPRVEALVGSPDHPRRVIPLPACSPPRYVRAIQNNLVQIIFPMIWRRIGASQIGSNTDDAYLDMRLNRADANVFMIRFKEPTFAATYTGGKITGQEDVRYWSLCEYDQTSGSVVACVHDFDAVRSRSGYVTVAISTLANRPDSATTANGVNWLPFGNDSVGLVVYRQLLPNPAFPGNIENVAPDALPGEVEADLGSYLPIVNSCSTASFTPTSCSDVASSLFCTDLIEPEPCPPATSERIAARPGGGTHAR